MIEIRWICDRCKDVYYEDKELNVHYILPKPMPMSIFREFMLCNPCQDEIQARFYKLMTKRTKRKTTNPIEGEK